MKKSKLSLLQILENSRFVQTIRMGLITIIPVLLVGAFSLIFRSFPNDAYRNFITTFASGFIYDFFNMLYYASFGMLSVYMTAAIAKSYHREYVGQADNTMSSIIASEGCFFILVGVFSADFTINVLGPKGMMFALLSGYVGSALCCRLLKHFTNNKHTMTSTVDNYFNLVMMTISSIVITLVVFTFVNTLITKLFNVTTFYQLIINSLTDFFKHVGNNFFGGMLMVLFSSLLWFFGIHGSDCLEGVMEVLFTPAIQVNMANVANGLAPTEILTKQFFDIFVLMGGCGAAMALLISIIVFSKRNTNKRLALDSFIPMIFNINETMIFGLPVILNPVLLIPFICTPLVCYFVSYFAMESGLVGLTIASVEWTTPVILGGYIATSSISGSILQLVNLLLGVAIYTPFVKMLDKKTISNAKDNYESLVRFYQQYESNDIEICLIELNSSFGDMARQLSSDIKDMITSKDCELFYQPQYDNKDNCVGCEALIRYKHPLYGYIYPPLIFKLANEIGMLYDLEKIILQKASIEKNSVRSVLGANCEISVNITGQTLLHDKLVDFLWETFGSEGTKNICIEITEKTAVQFDETTNDILEAIKLLGFKLAIDDFSMGKTSINYLQSKFFDYVKLDGGLTRGVLENPRCLEIISSIASLAQTLQFKLIAEFVDNEQQRNALLSVGCKIYQGYLYSPAASISSLASHHNSVAKRR